MFEVIFTHGLFDPATIEVLWTMAVSSLLLLAGTLTVYILPWSNAEIDAVYNTFAQLPSRLPNAIPNSIPNSTNFAPRTSR